MYCFPEKLHFNLQSDLTYFISHVKAIINGFGYATVLDVLDLLKTASGSGFCCERGGRGKRGWLDADQLCKHLDFTYLHNYGWTEFKTDAFANPYDYSNVITINKPIQLTKEITMKYKDIKTKADFNSVLEYCGYGGMGLGANRASFKPKKILKNGHATIFFWKDGSKTVVKAAEGDEMDLYSAFCNAAMKRIFGTNSAIKSCLRHTLIEGDWDD